MLRLFNNKNLGGIIMFDLNSHNLREGLINTINSSELPPTVIVYVLSDLLTIANRVLSQQITEQRAQLEETAKPQE